MASWGRNLALATLVATTGVAIMNDRVSAENADDLSKGIPSKEAAQRKTAMKLAGLATFVASSCTTLRLDTDRFKSAIDALGVSTKDLEDQKTKFAYYQYTLAYQKDVKASCARARSEFGPQGKTLPDLFRVVDVPLKAPPAGSATPPAGKAPDATAPDSKKP